MDNMSAQQIQEVVQAVEGLAPEEYYKERRILKCMSGTTAPSVLATALWMP